MQPKTAWGLSAGVAAVLCFVAALVSAYCGSACQPAGQGMPSQTDIAAYGIATTACIEGGNTRTEIDACRWGAKAQFCARFPAAGNCQGIALDGGGQ